MTAQAEQERPPTTYYCKQCGDIVLVTILNGIIRNCGHENAPVIANCSAVVYGESHFAKDE